MFPWFIFDFGPFCDACDVDWGALFYGTANITYFIIGWSGFYSVLGVESTTDCFAL
jgi:hypothetical protein